MAEYIEREALLEHIAGLSIIITGLSRGRNQLAEFGIRYKNSILRGINDFPAADVVPVRHGRWLHRKNGVAYCSECKIDAVEDGTNYCPNCGQQ